MSFLFPTKRDPGYSLTLQSLHVFEWRTVSMASWSSLGFSVKAAVQTRGWAHCAQEATESQALCCFSSGNC